MGSSIDFYCGQSDTDNITKYAETIGLYLISPTIDKPTTKSAIQSGPYALLSTVPQGEMTAVGIPPVRITDACHPVMRFMRSYYQEPYLVLGHVYWSNDNREMALMTKPFFRKIVSWVRSNWQKVGDFYYGPEAMGLIQSGAEKVNFLPGSVRETVVHLSLG